MMARDRVYQINDMARIVLFLFALSWVSFIQDSFKIGWLEHAAAVLLLVTAIAVVVVRSKRSELYEKAFIVCSLIEVVVTTYLIAETGGAQSPLFVAYIPIVTGIGLIWPNALGLEYVLVMMLVYAAAVIMGTNVIFREEVIQVFTLYIPTIVMMYFVFYAVSFAYSVEKERRSGLEYQLTHIKRTTARLKKVVSLAEEKAHKDSKTGLYNHAYFQNELRTQMGYSYRYSTPTSLLMCDIDRFKQINDTYGHQFGDIVLCRVAQILMDSVRSNDDTVARYGGEEMAIILPQCSKDRAYEIGERIRHCIEQEEFFKDGLNEPIRVTISVGVAESFGTETPEKFIQRADNALYEAKQTGRNRVVVR